MKVCLSYNAVYWERAGGGTVMGTANQRLTHRSHLVRRVRVGPREGAAPRGAPSKSSRTAGVPRQTPRSQVASGIEPPLPVTVRHCHSRWLPIHGPHFQVQSAADNLTVKLWNRKSSKAPGPSAQIPTQEKKTFKRF